MRQSTKINNIKKHNFSIFLFNVTEKLLITEISISVNHVVFFESILISTPFDVNQNTSHRLISNQGCLSFVFFSCTQLKTHFNVRLSWESKSNHNKEVLTAYQQYKWNSVFL